MDMDYEVLALEALLLLYKKGTFNPMSEIEGVFEQTYAPLPAGWKRQLKDNLNALEEAGLVEKTTEGRDDFFRVSTLMKTNLKNILKADPNKEEWDKEVLEQLLGRDSRPVGRRTRRGGSQVPESPAQTQDDDDETVNGRKRRRTRGRATPALEDAPATLDTPPPSSPDAIEDTPIRRSARTRGTRAASTTDDVEIEESPRAGRSKRRKVDGKFFR